MLKVIVLLIPVTDSSSVYFWSSDEVATTTDDRQAYGIKITGSDKADVKPSNEVYGFTVRCVTDVNPAGAE